MVVGARGGTGVAKILLGSAAEEVPHILDRAGLCASSENLDILKAGSLG
jgi:hypothetical protein